ncbi:MAG: 3-phosphoshikimate 1-carboxyvinyltransferase [Ignavibacterium sp.]|nr:3-phosphoshikimate 1-carboxyvinyltransferase [Ignavibacterium sp.]
MLKLEKIKKVNGELSFKGDKSISHRAIFFSSMANGISIIKNLSDCEDVNSTIEAFKLLGAEFESTKEKMIVKGIGKENFKKPHKEIYCGNSGTTARLISGILANQKFESTLTGDSSLSSRPMRRIIEPLEMMGAKIYHNEFKLPLTFYPSSKLSAIKYELKIPSAQVKSAVLISGLFIDEITSVVEKTTTRDHTERMLNLSFELYEDKKVIQSSSKNYPVSQDYFIPGDISSAAFFIVLCLISENSRLIIKNVSINPTRIGFVEILKMMNANISIEEFGKSNNEPYGNIVIKSSQLKNVEISPEIIPNIIDEIPILSLAGVFAKGDFTIRNCKELRYKETDRISALCYNYKLLGLDVDEYEDGFTISGSIKNQFANFTSFDDHRIAMTFSICSLLLGNGGSIDNPECVRISNPNFFNQLKSIIEN